MKKTSLFVITVIILLAGAGYAAWNVFVDDNTSPAENSNTVVENTNTGNVNTNGNSNASTNSNNSNTAAQTNTNTNSTNTNSQNNTNTSDEVSTSDWLTYESEEYGFSFKYPKEWGSVEIKKYSEDEYQVGEKTFLSFSNDNEIRVNNGYGTPSIAIETPNYKFTGPTDGRDILFGDINFSLSDTKLTEKIRRYPNSELEVSKVEVLNQKALKVLESYYYADLYIETLHYLIPNYREYNIRIAGDLKNVEDINLFIKSLKEV